MRSWKKVKVLLKILKVIVEGELAKGMLFDHSDHLRKPSFNPALAVLRTAWFLSVE
jgi:hypothetical protein